MRRNESKSITQKVLLLILEWNKMIRQKYKLSDLNYTYTNEIINKLNKENKETIR